MAGQMRKKGMSMVVNDRVDEKAERATSV